jgi:hypothetical protein
MPDLITHTIIPYVVIRLWSRLRRTAVPLFLLGCILPDILSRSFNVFLITWVPLITRYTDPVHAPCVALLYCLAISYFFAAPIRRTVFLNLLGGSLLHLLFDIGQRNIGHNYLLLYPFSRWFTEKGLFWPETTLYLVPWLVVLLGVVLIYEHRKKHL